MGNRLVVKVTCGTDDPERANQALTVAAAGVAAGASVSLWLTGEGAWFASADAVPDLGLEQATPAVDLLAAVRAGGTVTLCTQCAVRRGLDASNVAPGTRIAGAATFVEEALADGAQALVY